MLLSNAGSYGQYISPAMEYKNPVMAEDSNTLSLSYSNLFYFRDYEYFNSIQTGYTYQGTWQKPELIYQPNAWLKVHAGLLAQRDFGDKSFSHVRPVFSLQIKRKNFRFLFGALEGNQSHGLIEPLMSYDKVIERPVEEGVQFIWDSKRLKADLWLDWEILQTVNSNAPEELAGGVSINYYLTKPGKPWQLSVPVQFILPHKGGQLDTNNSNVSTIINHAQGLSATWNDPSGGSFIRQFTAEGYHASYFHSKKANPYPFNKGNAALFNLHLKSKYGVAFLASYWYGHQFIAPHGAKLFSSISSITTLTDYYETNRQLLTLNLIYEKQLAPGLYIDARFSPYYDFKNNLTEYSFLFLLSYRNIFKLISFPRRILLNAS